MKYLTLALTGALLLGSATLSQAADLAAGKAVWEKLNCASCHGADAVKSIDPSYPILAGQHADFLAHALKAYQRGASGAPATANVRKNAIMGAFAKQLSPQDIKNVSAWLAAQPGPLSVRR
ncbi:MAG: c-type cytochrome [Burkholderiaceae bacterium]|jgi:cytochrome c553|nr:c-type cytochrome [Burkholderiaceae bacterium]